jgi:hypothetical protein
VFTVVYVDKRTYLPVRVIAGPNVIDYLDVERIARTPETSICCTCPPTRRQRIVEGRFDDSVATGTRDPRSRRG